MSTYDAVIFDMFGTLTKGTCCPEDKIVETWHVDKKDGYEHTYVENVVCGTPCSTPFTDNEKEAYYNILIKKLGLPEESKQQLHELFQEDINGETMADGFKEIVEYAHQKGYKLGMISDLPNPDYDLAKKHGIDQYFDFRHLSYDPEWVNNREEGVGVLKPEPMVFKRVLDKLGVTAERTIMIGNTMRSDIIPARKLGMRGIVVDFANEIQDDDKVTSLHELKNKI